MKISTLVLSALLSNLSLASNPADDPMMKSTRTLINSWQADGKNWTSYGYGTLKEITVPIEPPPWADLKDLEYNTYHGETTTILEWTNGTTLEAVSYVDSEKPSDLPGGSARCSTEESAARACLYKEFYYWGDGWKGGVWYGPWTRTGSTGYNGGIVLYCDSITINPTFSGSISVGWGPIAGSLGISPEPSTTKGYCFGCTARTTGDKCSRFWYQKKMLWRHGNLWRNERRYDPQNNPCVFCDEFDRNILVGENVHADYAFEQGGIAQLVPGCSPCNE